MKITNKELYKALYFFKNITINNLFELAKKDSYEGIEEANFFEEKFKAEVFHARVGVFYDKNNNLFHCSIKPYNRGFEFHFLIKEDKIIESFFRKLMNIQIIIKNNDDKLSDISQQIYSFLKERNQHFEKDIIKEKVDNF